MSYVIKGYEPSRVFEFFEDICAIPHGSGNEKGIADYIEAFAKKNQLFCLRDTTGNIFVRKDATPGYEDREPYLLQGHMDMVCEKNSDSDHDFLTDPLKLSVKDGFLWADGTTLGGDDGIAVAMMLALLESDAHPTLECIFTVEEETGLAGAKGFDCSILTAKRMINLDSEEEDTVTVGCAGGVRTEVEFKYSAEPVDADHKTISISLTGLSGGHSGAEIHCGKTNAIIAMARLLGAARDAADLRIVSIECNGKDNAIARECFATVVTNNAVAVTERIKNETEELKKELAACDRTISLKIDECDDAETCIPYTVTDNIIAFMSTVKTGVLKMSNDISGLVEYSRNIGVVKTDNDRVRLTFSSRSSIEAQLDLSCREMDMLSKLAGADCKHYSRYPGWEYAPESTLRDRYVATYKKLFGKDVKVSVIHAGLECGILSSKMGKVDIISIGPDMYNIHSPEEHLDLSSCERVWKTVLEIIREG